MFIADYDSAAPRHEKRRAACARKAKTIETLEITLDQAMAMIASCGEIIDAKTVMLLQYAALKR